MIQLLLARVSLGRCKDFEGRCCSFRSVGGEITDAEWPKRQRGRPPPRADADPGELYDSVTGTEGDLAWAAHPRLKAN